MSHLLRFRQRDPAIAKDAPQKFQEARHYDADEGLQTALELSIELGQPLLLTGEPGCGKTAAAYWAAWYLGLDHRDVYHTQVRSNATADLLKYEFDNIGYLRESQVAASLGARWSDEETQKMRTRFVRKGPLWRAFEAASARPIVLLLDEIDKAPRDFPNDLLHEFDQLEFDVPEWIVDERPLVVSARPGKNSANGEKKPFILVIFTSNGERRLPDAFLRRCVHHHLAFDEARMNEIVLKRGKTEEKLANLTPDFVAHALKRFLVLKSQPDMNHRPGLAEFLVWLRVVAGEAKIDADRLRSLDVGQLPYLGLLLKDPDDRKRAEPASR